MSFCWVLTSNSQPRFVEPGNGTQSVTEKLGLATMDWTQLGLLGTGIGEGSRGRLDLETARKEARKNAEENAFNKLFRSVSMLPVNENETVGTIFKQKPEVKLLADQILHQFDVKDVVFFSNGGIEIQVEVSITPLLPGILGTSKGKPPIDPVSKEGKVLYSGLIVDTEGLIFYPVLSPLLLAEDGMVLYGPEKVLGDALHKRGMVSYHPSLESAQKDPRVGQNPLIVKALRLETRDALVIPSHKARSLQQSNLNLNFLEEGRLIIVLPMQKSS